MCLIIVYHTQLEPIVFPIMKRMISSEGSDVMEEVLELVAYFTYYSPGISPAMWSLWPQARSCACITVGSQHLLETAAARKGLRHAAHIVPGETMGPNGRGGGLCSKSCKC